jgi:hypothetical protein
MDIPVLELLEQVLGQRVYIDLQSDGKGRLRTHARALAAQCRSLYRLMQFERISPKSLIPEGVETEDLAPLRYELDGIVHDSILVR